MRLTVCITYNLDIKGDSAMALSLVKSPENTSHENTLRQPDNSWKLSLKIDKHTGETTGCDFNLHMIVDNDPYFNSYELNLFSGLVVVDRSRDFCEDDIEKALKYIIYEYEISSIAKDKLTTAIKNRARDHSFNPVVDYLSGLTWDGVSRIDTWLKDYMGAENSGYSSRVGKMWLVSMVARALQPGCKVDTSPILQGSQGVGKSTVLEALLPYPELFFVADNGVENKDFFILIQRAWLVEFAELAAFGKAQIEKIKSVFSTREDKLRLPYDRVGRTFKRHCVFVGTTNADDFLRDETGARRFLPVTVGSIKLEELKAIKDQLWAEAVSLYKTGFDYWTLPQDHKKEVDDRYAIDSWTENVLTAAWQQYKEKGIALLPEIAETALGLELKDLDYAKQTRIIRILKANGWEKCRTKSARGHRPGKEALELKEGSQEPAQPIPF